MKFVDRTFNCRHEHALAIWQYIKEHDRGITNFHFEIAADLLNEEELELLEVCGRAWYSWRSEFSPPILDTIHVLSDGRWILRRLRSG